ncbi:Large ribosomal subunit protein eL19z [Cardamine amara subsp. amara]|uniref:Large ribosomal subunit protein eL19z n=1 Tax=Cardamine amara subsp. amara TaxID=228776 RepID=A0ABD0ZH82_CARAN
MVSLKCSLAKRKNKTNRRDRQSGYGSRKYIMEVLLRRLKVLERILKLLKGLLKKYWQDKKIEKQVYNDMYMKVKGNVYKNKRVFMESIHKFSREIKFSSLAKEPEATPEPQQGEL